MVRSQDMNAGMRCIKYLLFLFNLLFAITGAILIVIGVTINAIFENYVAYLENRYLSPTVFIIVIGAVIFIVSGFGCYGAIRESTFVIMLFAGLLAIVFILEVCAGITGYVLQAGISEIIMEKMNSTMQLYNESEIVTTEIDLLQYELHCCGLQGISDWTGDSCEERCYPRSCCTDYDPTNDTASTCELVYSIGCSVKMEFILRRSALLLAGVAISIALLQLMGVMFACILGRSIRVHKTEREMLRQELQTRLIDSYNFGRGDPMQIYPVIYMDRIHENYNF